MKAVNIQPGDMWDVTEESDGTSIMATVKQETSRRREMAEPKGS